MAKKQAVRKPVVKKANFKPSSTPARAPASAQDNWIAWLFYAMLVLLPVMFSRISYDQFDLVKLAIFRVLILAVVFIWVAKMLTKSEPINWSWREGLLVAFLVLGTLSVLTSIHVPTALYGKYKRYEGLLTFITYLTAYFIAAQTFKGKERGRTLIEVISLAGALVAFYGILQYVGWDPIQWGGLPFEQRRSFSTFGNPDLLAGYLVLAFPCALVAYFYNNKRAWLHGVSALLLASALFTAMTRSGWAGALVSVIVIAVLLGRRILTYWKKIAIFMVPVVIVFLVVLVFSVNAQFNMIGKIASSFDYSSGSTSFNRTEIWKAGFRMMADKPLGQGLDTYRLASEHFESKAYVKAVAGTTVSDNAHNYPIQLAAGGGPLAAIVLYAFFILWIVRMVKVRRRMSDDDEKLIVTAALASIIGYLTTMMLGISIVGAGSTMWILMGAMVGLTRLYDPAYRSFSIKWSQELKLVVALSLIIITVVNAGLAVSMYVSDIYLVNGLVAAAGGNEPLASSNMNTAAALYPNNGRIMSELGQAYVRWAGAAAQQNNDKSFQYFTGKALESFTRATQAEPIEVDYRVFLANEYGYTGRSDKAIEILNGVLAQRPYSVPGNYLYGQFLDRGGRVREAIKYYELVVEIAPSYADSVSTLAGAYERVGDKAKAVKYRALAKKIQAAASP